MENSEIKWCGPTFNIVEGCSEVSPGCDNCYAKRNNTRWGKNNWDGALRIMKDSNWENPPKWQRKAVKEGTNPLVFCGSMCDVFDKNIPDSERNKLFKLIKNTPNLIWLLLTKRAPNIKKYLPDDWGPDYDNVWLGVSVENKKHGLPRINDLKKIPAKLSFLSCEPLLEDLGTLDLTGISWVIVGGESGAKVKRRPMKKEWVYNIKRQCEEQGVTFFFKQWNGDKKNPDDHLLDGKLYQNWPDGYIPPSQRVPLFDYSVFNIVNTFPNKPKTIRYNFKRANRKVLKQQMVIMEQYTRSEVLNVLNTSDNNGSSELSIILYKLFSDNPGMGKIISGNFRKSNRSLMTHQIAIMDQFSRADVLSVLDKYL